MLTELTTLSQTGDQSATLIEDSSNVYFYLFSMLNYKKEENRSIMGNCNSVDHIAEDHIHTHMSCNIEEPQQTYRLRTVSNGLQPVQEQKEEEQTPIK